MLLEGMPLVMNTLNFEYGAQQDDHIDTVYMPPKKRKLYACNVDCVGDDYCKCRPSALLRSGSHKISPYLFSHGKTNAINPELPGFYSYIQSELRERNIEAETLTAEAGDLFIWHAQLLHGGTPILQAEKTRRSLVTHYFRKSEYQHLFWRLKKVTTKATIIKVRTNY